MHKSSQNGGSVMFVHSLDAKFEDPTFVTEKGFEDLQQHESEQMHS